MDPEAIKELKRKEKELLLREEALKKKEEELRYREAALGIDVKNWPPFFPIIHHDIALDIPVHLQSMMYMAYYSWIGIMCCLAFNFIAVLASWLGSAVSATTGFANTILAVIYCALGIPLSYFLWYHRLYTAMRKDSALTFALFFIFYLGHCAFSIFASVAPPMIFKGDSLTGVYSALEMFTNGAGGVGALYSIGAGCFIVESLISVYVLQQVYEYFRGSGKASLVQREAALGAMGVGMR
eukprot:TRINITY_DN2711_c0_g1_i1.p1 TRINITY_DN2711_c0_g1~~TRINITY_DN2711_c0_g1_i1.p1  ORF type:complete len:240 (+),score=68.02 TRINITY_DN2711_c0_g1_i1:249-968(+)